MRVTHRLEWSGEAGFAARNKEWQARVARREIIEEKNRKHYTVPEPIPLSLFVQPYTEAHIINSFCHMVYGLRWEDEI